MTDRDYYNISHLQRKALFQMIKGARGGGRINWLIKRMGYERLLCDAIRLKIKYPLWREIDDIIEKINFCFQSPLATIAAAYPESLDEGIAVPGCRGAAGMMLGLR